MQEERESVGALIRRARLERGLTQRQLAERLHVTDKSVSKWERDVCRPDVALLEPLAEILGLGVLQLVTGQTEPEPEGAARQLADTSAREVCRKARRVNVRWLAALGVVLVLAAWALPTGTAAPTGPPWRSGGVPCGGPWAWRSGRRRRERPWRVWVD